MGKVPGIPQSRGAESDWMITRNRASTKSPARHFRSPAIYSLAFSPDGAVVAAGGSDGMVRLFNATNGAVIKEFVSVPLTKDNVAQARPAWARRGQGQRLSRRWLPNRCRITRRCSPSSMQPDRIRIGSPNDYAATPGDRPSGIGRHR